MRQKILKSTYLILGILSLSLGIIGIFLPILPTTPFLLLATFCFSRSSDRLHNWLLSHRVFGPPILDWNEHRVIGVRAKIFSISTISMGLLSVWIFFPETSSYFWIGKILTMTCMAMVMVFILRQRSKRTPQAAVKP